MDEALAAFARKYPEVVAKAEPDFLGTPCRDIDLMARYQAFAALVGRDEALPIVEGEPLLLAMLEPNLKDSWEALVEVAGGDRSVALRVARRHAACLTSPAAAMREKSLQEFEATADFMQSAKPYTDALRAAGPEGVVAGAVALGAAALAGAAGAALRGSQQADGRGRAQKPATPPPKPPVGKEVLRTAADLFMRGAAAWASSEADRRGSAQPPPSPPQRDKLR